MTSYDFTKDPIYDSNIFKFIINPMIQDLQTIDYHKDRLKKYDKQREVYSMLTYDIKCHTIFKGAVYGNNDDDEDEDEDEYDEDDYPRPRLPTVDNESWNKMTVRDRVEKMTFMGRWFYTSSGLSERDVFLQRLNIWHKYHEKDIEKMQRILCC
jgi:hypothetical protein